MRIHIAIRLSAVITVAASSLAGCASPQSPQGYTAQSDFAPEPGVAKVIFVRDHESGDSTLARIVDDHGTLLVVSAPGTNFPVRFPPGPHTFYSCAGEDTQALKVPLSAQARCTR